MYDDVEAGFEFDSRATPDIYTELTVVLVTRETWRVRDKLNFEKEKYKKSREREIWKGCRSGDS